MPSKEYKQNFAFLKNFFEKDGLTQLKMLIKNSMFSAGIIHG